MDFDLLGYNTDFKKGNITIKLHNKKYSKIPDINTISDVFDKSINNLIDHKINNNIDKIEPEIIKDILENEDNPVVDDIADEIAEEVQQDLYNLSNEDADLILNQLDDLIKNQNIDINWAKRGTGALIHTKLKGLVNRHPILNGLHENIKSAIASNLYNRYKKQHL